MARTVAPVGPLVTPGPELTPVELDRYHRHLLLPEIGLTGQRRIKGCRALVVGAGGLGAPVLTYLAAAGVGTIGIVDDDVVDTSNLQRQVLFGTADVGRPKVDVSAERLRAINPLVDVRTHRERVTAENALALFGDYDLVIDGTDNFATRYLVNDACVLVGIPYVWGSVFRWEGQVSVFWAEHGPQYRDLYPEPPPAGLVPSCAEGGVLGALCSVIGSTMAAEAIKLVTGVGEPLLGQLLVLDSLSMRWRRLAIPVHDQTVRISSLTEIDYEVVCGLPAPRPAGEDSITVAELRALLDQVARTPTTVVDVREVHEHEIGAIPGSVLIPRRRLTTGGGWSTLPRDHPVVLYCQSGLRSQACVDELRALGVTNVRTLVGGMAAWSRTR